MQHRRMVGSVLHSFARIQAKILISKNCLAILFVTLHLVDSKRALLMLSMYMSFTRPWLREPSPDFLIPVFAVLIELIM